MSKIKKDNDAKHKDVTTTQRRRKTKTLKRRKTKKPTIYNVYNKV